MSVNTNINSIVNNRRGGGITPPSVLYDGNTVAWFDYLENVTKDGSNLVSVWGDKSGLSHDLLQAVGTNQPLWTDNGILFDGVDDFLKTDTFTLEQPEFIYIVFKQVTWVDSGRILDGFVTNSGAIYQNENSPSIRSFAGRVTSGLALNRALPIDVFDICRICFNADNSYMRINDLPKNIGNPGTNDLNGLTLARRGNTESDYGNIEIKEIIIRNKIDTDSDESDIFNYLKRKYSSDIFFNNNNISQLDIIIDFQRGNYIFGYDVVNDKVLYSNDGGVTYTEKSFTGAIDIGMSYIFTNGNIIWSDGEKFYMSNDELLTYSEINVTDNNGDPFPIIVGGKNYLCVRHIKSEILGNEKEMIVFGTYTNVFNNGYVALFYSIDGESVKTAYMFGQNSNYGSYGDATNPIIARHIHSATYSDNSGKWYWNTGDNANGADLECHFFESTYNYLTDTWSHTLLLSGDSSTHIKAGALFSYGDDIYFGSDNTGGVFADERGMWKVSEDHLETVIDHERIFNYNNYIIGGHCVVNDIGVAFFSGVEYNDGKYSVCVYNINSPSEYVIREFIMNPSQTNPDKYIGWKITYISDSYVLANVFSLIGNVYESKTIKIII